MIQCNKKINLLHKLRNMSFSSLPCSKIKEINDIDLTKFNAIGYMGRNSSYLYSTHNGEILCTKSSKSQTASHVKQVFEDIQDFSTKADCKLLIVVEEDYVLKDMQKADFENQNTILNRMKENGCKIIGAAEYHSRFGFKVPNNTPPLNEQEKRIVYYLYDGKCAYCSKDLCFTDSQIDHIVPKKEGGNDYYKNWALVCEPCNEKKSNRIFGDPEECIGEKGKNYIRRLSECYHFYKAKIDNDERYSLVREQKNFGFRKYFTIYKKVNNKYVNRDNKNGGYQFIINTVNKDNLEKIKENGNEISGKEIENALDPKGTDMCGTSKIDNWLS